MKKPINKEYVEGRVHSHKLALKTVQNTSSENYGKEFINGSVDIATSEDGMNIVTVKFIYVTPTTSKGGKNETYTVLKQIIDSNATVEAVGADKAMMIKIDTSLGLNDFYTSRDGEEKLVSAKENSGGFAHIITSLKEDESKRNFFEVDMLINGTRVVEANEERNIPDDYLIVKGAVFNFRNEILPVEFAVRNPGGMKYFESLDASSTNLVFTKVWGNINSLVTKTSKTEESAFGEAIVKEYTSSSKEWTITGCASEPYEIGDEKNGITTEEVKKALETRETYLADVKRKADEYKASQQATTAAAPVGTTAASGAFNF